MPEESAASGNILKFEDVSLRFGDTPAMEHITFDLAPGDTRVVYGVAGAGKTSVLKTALGLVQADSGRIQLFGQDVTNLKESEWFSVRSKMGILFQEGGLFDSMTIAENVAYPLLNQPARKLENGNVDEKVRETLRFVELEQTLEKFPSELSGGMRRRVGIARAIVTEPALLLYDSPTAGLDPITANTIINLIIKQRDLRNAATLMVTHRFQDGHLMANFRYNPDSGQVEPVPQNGDDESRKNQMKTKFFVMNEGRLVFAGSQAELKASKDEYVRKFAK